MWEGAGQGPEGLGYSESEQWRLGRGVAGSDFCLVESSTVRSVLSAVSVSEWRTGALQKKKKIKGPQKLNI